MIVDGKINHTKSLKTIEPINLNGDDAILTIDTTISKRDVLSNQSEEECSEMLELCECLVDDNPNLNYQNFVMNYRNNFSITSALVA